ncbi:MAG TPA: hypothetical protein VMU93_08635 [Caulobacteraceae bacterium]|nr:hypothetical protein [Caulobacteraceae bacterium]
MKRTWRAGAAVLAAALGGGGLAACAAYHLERPALRMARPQAEPAALSLYAPPSDNYPSVGGDILKGTSPTSVAAYEATTAAPANATAAPAPRS